MPKAKKRNAKSDKERTAQTEDPGIEKVSNPLGFIGRGKPKGGGKGWGGGRPYIPDPPSIEPPEEWAS